MSGEPELSPEAEALLRRLADGGGQCVVIVEAPEVVARVGGSFIDWLAYRAAKLGKLGRALEEVRVVCGISLEVASHTGEDVGLPDADRVLWIEAAHTDRTSLEERLPGKRPGDFKGWPWTTA